MFKSIVDKWSEERLIKQIKTVLSFPVENRREVELNYMKKKLVELYEAIICTECNRELRDVDFIVGIILENENVTPSELKTTCSACKQGVI